MNGQAKIELMLSLRNKIRGGLNQAKQDTFKSVNAMQAKMNTLKFNFAKNSKEIMNEVPLIGNAFRLVSNPIALTVAGVAALGKGIDYTTQKAANFNTQFRNLANLNLDKSKREIDSLRRMVLDTAYDKGFNTDKTVMGYFDVQSTTGKFGGEVKRIVEKQGEFANLMQADFNEYIAGTAKGMANFGFGAEKLDEFNRSAYATVKVGVTTFDQLAKVQSVYAGAAAANNQTFDTANKLLALFTVKTKSADEAATLTKSMFNDLTKDATIKAFKKIGISIYDTNGNIKQADSLMMELNKKFLALDGDKKVIALKNQFTGSDGLISLVQAATDKSGQLQNTFNSFDSTKLGLNKALELARNDVNYINETLQNKIKALEIEIGTNLLPLKEWWAQLKLEMINGVMWVIRGEKGNRNKQYNEGWTKQSEEYGGVLQSAANLTKEQYTKKLAELNIAMKAVESAHWKIAKDVNNIPLPWGGFLWTDERKNEWRTEQSGYVLDYSKGKIDYTKNLIRDFQNEWQTKTNFGRNVLSHPDPTKKGDANSNGNANSTTLGSSVDSVTGSARQIRNLTVNIEAFNKGGINTQNTNLQHMEPTQIEEWFTDMCMRVVRSIESTY
ncbi:phage tail tape measure protein [Bacteroides xylanisolvens]|jgi:TP901 family phage tail tape measure protein|uniref:phage tail tape measure protein n=1 Tax=Bacteroides xylanisolvens TaxID=371601 RepID=UPI0035698C3A